MSIITKVAKRYASSRFNAELIYLFLGEIEGDWYAEEVAICESVLLNDTAMLLME